MACRARGFSFDGSAIELTMPQGLVANGDTDEGINGNPGLGPGPQGTAPTKTYSTCRDRSHEIQVQDGFWYVNGYEIANPTTTIGVGCP